MLQNIYQFITKGWRDFQKCNTTEWLMVSCVQYLSWLHHLFRPYPQYQWLSQVLLHKYISAICYKSVSLFKFYLRRHYFHYFCLYHLYFHYFPLHHLYFPHFSYLKTCNDQNVLMKTWGEWKKKVCTTRTWFLLDLFSCCKQKKCD